MECLKLTSKASLKMSCLRACDNDIEQADKLYSFIAADLAELPDFDPIQPSGFEAVKSVADDILSWINGHREDIAQGVSLINAIRNKAGAAPVAASSVIPDVPPIPKV